MCFCNLKFKKPNLKVQDKIYMGKKCTVCLTEPLNILIPPPCCAAATTSCLAVPKHVLVEHCISVNDHTWMISWYAGIKQRNQVFRDIIALTVICIIIAFFIPAEQIVHCQVDIKVGPLKLSDDQVSRPINVEMLTSNCNLSKNN